MIAARLSCVLLGAILVSQQIHNAYAKQEGEPSSALGKTSQLLEPIIVLDLVGRPGKEVEDSLESARMSDKPMAVVLGGDSEGLDLRRCLALTAELNSLVAVVFDSIEVPEAELIWFLKRKPGLPVVLSERTAIHIVRDVSRKALPFDFVPKRDEAEPLFVEYLTPPVSLSFLTEEHFWRAYLFNGTEFWSGSATPIPRGYIKHFVHFTSMKYLVLDHIKLRDEELALCKWMTQLQRLSIAHTAIDGSGLALVPPDSVTELNLSYNPRFRHWKYLSRFTNLETLWVFHSTFGDDDIAALCNLPKLKQFQAFRTQISADGARKLLSMVPTIKYFPVTTDTWPEGSYERLKLDFPKVIIK